MTFEAHATSPAPSDAVTLWKRQVHRQLVPALHQANFKSFATDRAQTLYVQFRIDEHGRAHSISFTEKTDAEPSTKIAFERVISAVDFQTPPSGAGVDWLVLPLTIEARQPDAAQPLPN